MNIKEILSGRTPGAKIYQIIAAISLQIDLLSEEECAEINKKYAPTFFKISKDKNGRRVLEVKTFARHKADEARADLHELIEMDNERRVLRDEALIEYDDARITFSHTILSVL